MSKWTGPKRADELPMNDDTRNEIVRLARKGWSISQIRVQIGGPWTGPSEGTIQEVIDEAEDQSA